MQMVRVYDQGNEIFKIRLFHDVPMTEKRQTLDFGLQTSDSNFDIMALLVIVHNIPQGMQALKEGILKKRMTKDIVPAVDSR